MAKSAPSRWRSPTPTSWWSPTPGRPTARWPPSAAAIVHVQW